MKSSQIQKTSIPKGSIPLLAILITPAHIAMVHDMADIVPKFLRQVFEIHKEGLHFDVLTAVVDRIPYPTFTKEDDQARRQTLVAGCPPGMLVEDGIEGMSFAVLDSKSAAPDLWSARLEPGEVETMSIQQRYTLSFAFPLTTISIPAFADGKERTQSLVSRVLQLPVANTLFQIGKTSLMRAQRWRSQGSPASTSALSCCREVVLPQQTLHMTDIFSDQSTALQQSLCSCLISITPTRVITAAMGNIIRRISVDDISNESVPASGELELAISTAIKDGLIPAEQTGIWALVRPANLLSPIQPGIDREGEVNYEIEQAVLHGCRLHKVLSGGGGWGEKQGLLSLDPDFDYRVSQQAFEPSYWENQDGESDRVQAFGEIVKPGDTVKFYIQRAPRSQRPMTERSFASDSAKNAPSLSLRFGSLPSKMDAMPEKSRGERDLPSQATCTVHQNHFGMLSEQGMSLEVSVPM